MSAVEPIVSAAHSLLIIHGWKSGILMMGETPQDAMTGTSSCMTPSGVSVSTLIIRYWRVYQSIPSMLPCSQSTQIQSGLALASALEILVLGTIPGYISGCHDKVSSRACPYSSARSHSWARCSLRKPFAVYWTFA